MRYRAKILTAAMTVDSTEFDAVSEEEARRFVEASGSKVLGLETLDRSGLSNFRSRKKFNLAVFNQQLSTLLDAGQPVVDAIEILGRNDRHGQHRGIYDTLLDGLRQGRQLSEAMSALPSVFPALYVAMVRSSETTGTVRAAIQRFMHYQRQVDEIRGKLISAAIYPAILITVGFVVIAFLMLYVVPRFSEVFEDIAARQQASAGFVQLWGGFVRNHALVAWSAFIGIIVASVAGIVHPKTRAKVFQKFIQLPAIGEKVWLLQLARMYRTLGMLLKSGVSMLAAMRMTEGALATGFRDNLQRAIGLVSEGKPLSIVMMECGLSTDLAQRLLVAGESSGNLDEMMEKIADFYDQEMSTWIDTAGRLVEPILMVGIGLVIGAVVLMLYTPIFDLANAV